MGRWFRGTSKTMTLFRRHQKNCLPGRIQGRECTSCDCPVWRDDRADGGKLRSLGTSDWAKAEAMRAGEPVGLLEASAKWLAHVVRQGSKPVTIEKYKTVVCQFIVYAGKWGFTSLHDVQRETIQAFAEGRPGAPATRAKRVTILKQFLGWCCYQGWLQSNPAGSVESPKIRPTRFPCAFTKEQTAAILQELGADRDKRYELLARLMLATGLRISDAVAIEPDQLQDGEIRLRTKKTAGEVRLPLEAGLFRTVVAQVQSGGFHPCQSTPCFVRAAQRRFKAAFVAAGIPKATVHTLRHDFASRLASRGATTQEIARAMGISTAVADKTYIHMTSTWQNRIRELVL